MKWIGALLDAIVRIFTSCSSLRCHSTCCDAEFEITNEHHEENQEENQEKEEENPEYIKHYDEKGNLNIVKI